MTLCVICKENHDIKNCPILCQTPEKSDNDKPTLAELSLPSWVYLKRVRKGDCKIVITNRFIQKHTKLGPLLAPVSSASQLNIEFRLHIILNDKRMVLLDQTNEETSNWLSLIPSSSECYNLLAYQLEEKIYFLADRDIQRGENLYVWYAPFYKHPNNCPDEETVCDSESKNENEGPCYKDNDQSSIVSEKSLSQNETEFTDKSDENLISLQETPFKSEKNCSDTIDTFSVESQLSNTVTVNNIYTNSQNLGINTEKTNTNKLYDSTTKEKLGSDIGFVSYENSITNADNNVNDLYVPVQVHNLQKISIERNKIIYTHTDPSKMDRKNGKSIIQLSKVPSDSKLVGENLSTEKDSLNYSLEVLENSEDDMKDSVIIGIRKHGTDDITHKLLSITNDSSNRKLVDKSSLTSRSLGAQNPKRIWVCGYCKATFPELIEFARHLKRHILWLCGKKYACRYCNRCSNSEAELKRHEYINHFSSAESNLHNHDLDFSQDDPDSQKDNLQALPTDNQKEDLFPCQICSKVFNNPQYLLRHLAKHTADFSCGDCLKAFARKESLMKHICTSSSHRTSDKLVCPTCLKSFNSELLLQRHQIKHQNPERCEFCNKVYTSKLVKKRHMFYCTKLLPRPIFKCNICNKEFHSEGLLKKHTKSHDSTLNCATCERSFSSKSHMVRHQVLCSQVNSIRTEGGVSCQECSAFFKSEKEFRLHYQTHTHPYNCSTCKQYFRTKVAFEVHVCNEERSCDQCGTMFSSIQALNKHLHTHGPPEFSCSDCGRLFKRKDCLKLHKCNLKKSASTVTNEDIKIDVKDEEEPEMNKIPCTKCSLQFSSINNMRKHFAVRHGGPETHIYSCNECGKKFGRIDLLHEHESTHSAPKFPCNVCNKLFKSQRSLNVHERLHYDISRFACRYCNKEFNQKINLQRHELSHKPVGAIYCQHCGAQCSSKKHLESHLLTHTQQEFRLQVTDGNSLSEKPASPNEMETSNCENAADPEGVEDGSFSTPFERNHNTEDTAEEYYIIPTENNDKKLKCQSKGFSKQAKKRIEFDSSDNSNIQSSQNAVEKNQLQESTYQSEQNKELVVENVIKLEEPPMVYYSLPNF